ncbi:MAG: BREX-1 system adenine-specific DNA-methyltransferase PglX [Acholeplasmataceae bacterium]
MNKRELQNFAVWAKENLENQIKVSLNLMGIHSDKNIKRAFVQGDITVIEGESKTFPKNFKVSRDNIVRIIKDEGYENVVEQFAYTWFNRIVALRFMEVHGYLDHGFKLFPDGGTVEPEILGNLHFIKDDLNLDTDYYIKLKEEDNIEGLYRYVLFKQCNALSRILPMLFSDEYEYLEYLLPSVLLTGETIITRIVELEKDNFLSDVEVIGWLYQFYISSKKDAVFASKERITKDTLPAVTQLFTPDWIVKYMAENSIGRIWLESYPNSLLKNGMKYYVEEAEQTEEVQKELEKIRYKNANPEDIKIIEPAAGSGHILVYAFDLLLKMYEEHGHSKRDIPTLILKNNLVGLDVDKRASQLAQFALMMKARSIDPRFFNDTRRITPKVFEIKDSKKLNKLNYRENLKELIENDWKKSEHNLSENDLKLIEYLVTTFEDAKVIGSLLKVKPSKGYLVVANKINKLRKTTVGGVFTNEFVLYGLKRLSELLRLAHFMSLKYDVMITNPPYQAIGSTEDFMKEYASKEYPRTKLDMYSMFMDTNFIKENGFISLINQHQWMFVSSFEDYRKYLMKEKMIVNLLHLGPRAFETISGEKVQSVSFVIRNINVKVKSVFIRLTKFKSPLEKEKRFNEYLNGAKQNEYTFKVENTKVIPGHPIAYWAEREIINSFENKTIGDYAYIGKGLDTCYQDLFERKWYEVSSEKISFDGYHENKKWFLFSKGGGYRRWYGNVLDIVLWENQGDKIRNYRDNKGKVKSRPQNTDKYFKSCISWSSVGTGSFGARLITGSVFGNGSAMFTKNKDYDYPLMALLNSNISKIYLEFLSPTLTFNAGDLKKIPVVQSILNNNEIKYLVSENVKLMNRDWMLKEFTWEFSKNILIDFSEKSIPLIFDKVRNESVFNATKVKDNEEKLNQIIKCIYELETVETKVKNNEITINIVDLTEVKDLISYLTGVLMGRYSLVEEGLIYAGGEFDSTRYGNYEVDEDGIIPIYSKLGMEDGLTAKIITLVKQIYGEDTYKENIDFIAEGLGKKQNETSEETLNRYLNDEFYKDHLKTYQKRPIYWMFSSGKEKGFKVLIYLHRYTEDTLAMINSNYLLPETTRLRNELNDLENAIKTSDDITRRRLEKERDIVNKQYYEAVEYGLVLDHMANRYINLDLDDGVKVNYEKFQNVEIVNERGTKIKKDLLVPIK